MIDNGSCDESHEYFSKFNNINYIRLNKNIGFPNANNLAFNHTKGKYLLLLNSDTLLLNNSICISNEMENADDNVAFMGTKLLERDGVTIGTFAERFHQLSTISFKV